MGEMIFVCKRVGLKEGLLMVMAMGKRSSLMYFGRFHSWRSVMERRVRREKMAACISSPPRVRLGLLSANKVRVEISVERLTRRVKGRVLGRGGGGVDGDEECCRILGRRGGGGGTMGGKRVESLFIN